jgi:hypothetical protein|nr:MAG TPA: hypothetical protein [Caudoviricetes sp.]
MNKEFLIGLTVIFLVLAVVVTIAMTSPASVVCETAGCVRRIVYSLPDGYDLNFKNPYNVIDTENGIDVVFHFSKED